MFLWVIVRDPRTELHHNSGYQISAPSDFLQKYYIATPTMDGHASIPVEVWGKKLIKLIKVQYIFYKCVLTQKKKTLAHFVLQIYFVAEMNSKTHNL